MAESKINNINKKIVYGAWTIVPSGYTFPENGQLAVTGINPSASNVTYERIDISSVFNVLLAVKPGASGSVAVNVAKNDTWSYLDGTLSNLTAIFRPMTIQ